MAAWKRFTIPNLGRWYSDLLKIDAAINNRSVGLQAQSLLSAKLQEREKTIKDRVQYIADRDKRPFQEVWDGILSDTYDLGANAGEPPKDED